MKHLRKFNESSDFKNTDEEIREFFLDYIDLDKDALKIENVLISKTNFETGRIVKETPYMKDISKYKRCRLMTLNVDYEEGIYIDNNGCCLKSFDLLENIIEDIKRFYSLIDEEPNYTIKTDYSGLVVNFITSGGHIKEGESKSEIIDKYLLELKEIFKKHYKRTTVDGNWLEIKTSKKDASRSPYGDISFDLRNLINKINSGEINTNNTNPDNKFRIYLLNFKDKIAEDNLKMHTSGGDHQLVIQLL